MDAYKAAVREHYHELYKKYIHEQDITGSSIARIINDVQFIKYNYNPPRHGLTVTAFRVNRGSDSAVYALLYSKISGGEVEHQWITCGPSYVSADGEYRKSFVNWSKWSYDGPDTLAAEEVAAAQLESGAISFEVDFVLPDQKYKKNLEESVNSSRLAIKFYATCLLLYSQDAKNQTISDHINPQFKRIISADVIPKPQTADRFLGRPTVVGAKLFQLSTQDVMYPGDPSSKVWAEIDITRRVADLVLNFAASGFAVPCNWFFVYSNENLYENEPMQERFADTEVANEVGRQLREIDKRYFADPATTRRLKISRSLQKSVAVAEREQAIINQSLVFITEFVGPTLGNMLAMPSGFNADRDEFLQNIDKIRDAITELFHNLCVMHKHGIVHCDLHLNNITVRWIKPDRLRPDHDNIMRLDGVEYRRADTNRAFAIIDFSCAVADLSREVADQHQINKGLKFVYLHRPDLAKKYADAILRGDFQKFLQVLALLDGEVLAKNLVIAFAELKPIADFCATLSADFASTFDAEFQKLIDGNPDVTSSTIFARQFAHCRRNPTQPVANYYDGDKKLQWSFDSFENWGPFLDITAELSLRKEHGLPPIQAVDAFFDDRIAREISEQESMEPHPPTDLPLLRFEDWMMD